MYRFLAGTRRGKKARQTEIVARLTVMVLTALLFEACGALGGGSSSSIPPPPVVTQAPGISANAPLGINLTALTFTNSTGTQIRISVRVEASESAREHGLMNVSKLPDSLGDLFVWMDVAPNRDVVAPFWMKDTLIPLSIAFISNDGRVLEEQDMQAETTVLHVPHQPYRFALEANLGWFDRNKLGIGSTVDLPAALPEGSATATPR